MTDTDSLPRRQDGFGVAKVASLAALQTQESCLSVSSTTSAAAGASLWDLRKQITAALDCSRRLSNSANLNNNNSGSIEDSDAEHDTARVPVTALMQMLDVLREQVESRKTQRALKKRVKKEAAQREALQVQLSTALARVSEMSLTPRDSLKPDHDTTAPPSEVGISEPLPPSTDAVGVRTVSELNPRLEGGLTQQSFQRDAKDACAHDTKEGGSRPQRSALKARPALITRSSSPSEDSRTAALCTGESMDARSSKTDELSPQETETLRSDSADPKETLKQARLALVQEREKVRGLQKRVADLKAELEAARKADAKSSWWFWGGATSPRSAAHASLNSSPPSDEAVMKELVQTKVALAEAEMRVVQARRESARLRIAISKMKQQRDTARTQHEREKQEVGALMVDVYALRQKHADLQEQVLKKHSELDVEAVQCQAPGSVKSLSPSTSMCRDVPEWSCMSMTLADLEDAVVTPRERGNARMSTDYDENPQISNALAKGRQAAS